MTHLSLFSGIGGLDLAAEMAGFKTVGQVEIDDYCNRVLEYHWPNVPRWRDVKDVTAESFERRTGIKPGTLAVLSGGFPCQPFSAAGKRRGESDNRYLWPEMLRVICEIRPRWIVAENVRGILSIDTGRTFGRILTDLAQNGYRAGWLCYGAGDIGAPHRRERVFIVGHAEGNTGSTVGEVWQGQVANAGGICSKPGYVADAESRQDNRREPGELAGKAEAGASCNPAVNPGSQDVADAYGHNRQRGGGNVQVGRLGSKERVEQNDTAGRNERPTQSGLGNSPDGLPSGLAGHRWPAGPGEQHEWEPPRIATGVKDRVAKLKALGNAVVPAQAYPILRAIRETEEDAIS